MKAWNERAVEQAALFNPALLALIAAAGAKGAADKGGLPWPLTFLVVPLALHRPTREALPRTTTTSLAVWLDRHPEARVGFSERARDLAPLTREGIRLGLTLGALTLEEGRLRRGETRRRTRRVLTSAERDACLERAEFLGRWLTGASDVATVYAHLGVRP